jgi:hypothetical protein
MRFCAFLYHANCVKEPDNRNFLHEYFKDSQIQQVPRNQPAVFSKNRFQRKQNFRIRRILKPFQPRLFQNISFWNSFLNLVEKPGLAGFSRSLV